MSSRPLRRKRENQLIAGVISGLADYVGLDVTIARVLFVLASVLSAAFPGLIVYVLLWMLMPADI